MTIHRMTMLMTTHRVVTKAMTIAGDSEGASRVLQTCWVVARRHMPCLFTKLEEEVKVHDEEEEGEEVVDFGGTRRKVKFCIGWPKD